MKKLCEYSELEKLNETLQSEIQKLKSEKRDLHESLDVVRRTCKLYFYTFTIFCEDKNRIEKLKQSYTKNTKKDKDEIDHLTKLIEQLKDDHKRKIDMMAEESKFVRTYIQF